MQYKRLTSDVISEDFLSTFERHQEVKKCWRKVQGEWILQPIAFMEDWDAEELRKISLGLKKTAASGAVFAAFPDGSSHPAAFAAVEGEPIGSHGQYLVLHELHTDARYRSQGIGTELFRLACLYARERGIEKLYISAHSSEESQRFYRRQGCMDAEEIDPHLYELEPCDCHLEIRTDSYGVSGADKKF